jgi:hypothetical protein
VADVMSSPAFLTVRRMSSLSSLSLARIETNWFRDVN